MSDVAAHYMGVDVPRSPYLNATRIERINAGRYEGQEIAGALHVTRPGDRVLELGAGLGIVGAVVAENAGPSLVRAFEANPNLIPEIRKLYEINALTETISVEHAVLVSAPDRPATLPFQVRKTSYLGSSLNAPANDSHETVHVATKAWDDVMAEVAPQVILMDIEGGEREILSHAGLDGVRAIVIEFHPEQYERAGMIACKDILRGAGFAPIPEMSTRTVWVATREMT